MIIYTFLYKKFFLEHNMSIRLILVELRVIWDFNYEFCIIRAKIYNGVMTLYYYMSAMKSILFVGKLYRICISFFLWL